MAEVQRGRSRGQLPVFGLLLGVNALAAVAYYLLAPVDQLVPNQSAPGPMADLPAWLLGLANGGIVLVAYGALGLAGFWLSRRLGLPGIFREKAGRREWVVKPMLLGTMVGVAITALDRVFAAASPTWNGFIHPPFPLSVVASTTAGIGEEIIFRLFVLSLWAFLLKLILGRFGAGGAALWLGNLIAALAFAAGHLPALILLVGNSSVAAIPGLVLAELLLLNGLLGMVAGWQYLRNGLVAAVGVHFWADVVWHVLWPVLQGLA